MANNFANELFYTLDEEKRELVAHGIQVGDRLKLIMQISKKYITGNQDDNDKLVNIDIGEITNISTSLQRKTTVDYIPGQRDPASFSRGHVLGNGRMICPVLDRELINFIFGDLHKNAPNSTIFDMTETSSTFGNEFEIEEISQLKLPFDRDDLVGGNNIVFSKGKEYIYLDDVPLFNLRFLGRADTVKNIVKFGETDGLNEYSTGAIYQRKIERVKFIGNSTDMNAIDPISNEVIDFAIYGNDTGWKPLD